jgi:hypothetical protein
MIRTSDHTLTSTCPSAISSLPKTTKPTLTTLPPEVLLLITSHLPYPDALSLKYTSTTFYPFVYTGIKLKIEWLIERRRMHLDCPDRKRCEMGDDSAFCRGSIG